MTMDGTPRSLARRLTLAGALAVSAALALPASAAFAADRLPDLGMAHPRDFKIENSNGRKLLRYTAIVVNVGAGPFEIHGVRPNTSSPMTVTQRIYDDSTGYRDVTVSGAQMSWSGDGHNHWHVQDLETGELIRRDNGSKVGALAKHGFCFFDNYSYRLSLPGAPTSPRYTNCGSQTSLHIVPGLSVGWGDIYNWSTAYQYIDITGVSNGQYRLQLSASTALGFLESNYSNNVSWVDLTLQKNRVRNVTHGPAA